MTRQRSNVDDADDRSAASAVRSLLERRSDSPVPTEVVASELDLDVSTARSRLEELAASGDVTEVRDADGGPAWECSETTVVVQRDGNSYAVRDEATGLVSRGRSRADAVARLSERIREFESGAPLAAQVLGVADAAISPAYLDGVEDVLDTFVRPSYASFYVFVDGEGVVEVEDPDAFDRSRRITGFAATATVDLDRFDDLMVVSLEEVLSETPLRRAHFPLGVFKVVAVPPAYQRQGIGSRLVGHAMAHLCEDPPVVTFLWDRDDDANVPLVEQYGADRLGAFEDVLSLGRRCTLCGFGNECDCGVELYGWKLDAVEEG